MIHNDVFGLVKGSYLLDTMTHSIELLDAIINTWLCFKKITSMYHAYTH